MFPIVFDLGSLRLSALLAQDFYPSMLYRLVVGFPNPPSFYQCEFEKTLKYPTYFNFDAVSP